MMKQAFRLAVCVIGLTAFASQASAQALPWEGRGFLNVNFGLQLIAEDVATTTTSFTVYDETGKLTTAQTIDSQAPFWEIGGGFRIAGNFGAGFTYTRLSATGAADVQAQVPSPIYYDQPRTVTATVNDLEHVEEGYHFQALWMLPITDKLDIVFSGGPSIFNLKQGAVTSPQITEVGPPVHDRQHDRVAGHDHRQPDRVQYRRGHDLPLRQQLRHWRDRALRGGDGEPGA